MNQEQNNLNLNNFNVQGNNEILDNQSLQNNESVNNNIYQNQNIQKNSNINVQSFASQPQPMQNINATNIYSQPQQSIPPSMIPSESVNVSNQNLNNKPQKKINLGLIMGIAIAVIVCIVVVVFLINNQNKNDGDENNNNNNFFETNNTENKGNINNSSNFTGVVEEGTNTIYDENGAFLFRIEDIFTISGRGTVVTGTVERGTINLNDEVQIIGLDKEIITTIVSGVEVFRKDQDYATIGDNPGLLLKGVKRDQVQIGQVVAKPHSITTTKKFDADLSVISTEEGGRGTPFYDGFSPQFYFKTDIQGKIDLPDGKEMVNPGEEVSVTITLTNSIAMDIGTKFSIREGGRTIANGVVTKVY